MYYKTDGGFCYFYIFKGDANRSRFWMNTGIMAPRLKYLNYHFVHKLSN